jgi:hypothetical protein
MSFRSAKLFSINCKRDSNIAITSTRPEAGTKPSKPPRPLMKNLIDGNFRSSTTEFVQNILCNSQSYFRR